MSKEKTNPYYCVAKFLKPFVPNYHINLIQVAFLPEEVIGKFTSDFRQVAQFFRAKRLGKEKELRYNREKWTHVAEMMDFLHTFAGDRRYRELKADMLEEVGKGGAAMCTLIDMIERETREKVEKETTAKVSYKLLDTFLKNSGKSLEEALLLFEFSEEDAEGYKCWKAGNLSSRNTD